MAAAQRHVSAILGRKGVAAGDWADDRLEMKTCRDMSVPIRYGRRSSSRGGEFTIVLGCQTTGVAKIADLKCSLVIEDGAFATSTEKLIEDEVLALAEAEGIWKDQNNKIPVENGGGCQSA